MNRQIGMIVLKAEFNIDNLSREVCAGMGIRTIYRDMIPNAGKMPKRDGWISCKMKNAG